MELTVGILARRATSFPFPCSLYPIKKDGEAKPHRLILKGTCHQRLKARDPICIIVPIRCTKPHHVTHGGSYRMECGERGPDGRASGDADGAGRVQEVVVGASWGSLGAGSGGGSAWGKFRGSTPGSTIESVSILLQVYIKYLMRTNRMSLIESCCGHTATRLSTLTLISKQATTGNHDALKPGCRSWGGFGHGPGLAPGPRRASAWGSGGPAPGPVGPWPAWGGYPQDRTFSECVVQPLTGANLIFSSHTQGPND